MKIYLIESVNNKELYDYLRQKYIVVTNRRLYEANVIIVNKINNIRLALDIIDYALSQGKEIICIKDSFSKEYYVSNYLIQNGANYI